MESASIRKTPPDGPNPDPILILGISERCGTNFLFHLLCLHPDCDSGGPLWENYLTLHFEHLVRYAERVYAEWNPNWRVPETLGPADTLLADIGQGLTRYLNRQRNATLRSPAGRVRRLVSKTPSVSGLPHVGRILPGAALLVLVREGPAVVESAHRSFGSSYESGIRNWAAAARTILEWQDRNMGEGADSTGASRRGLLVRYEDLVLRNENELRRIFRFLDLDPEACDYTQASALPVIGSSELKGESGRLHWDGIRKRADFAPTTRGSNWTAARQYRFAWLAGREAERLGYTVRRPERFRALWMLWHLAMDGLWQASSLAARVRRFVTSRGGRA